MLLMCTWVFDTGLVAHICNSKQEPQIKQRLAKDEVTMRVRNGSVGERSISKNLPTITQDLSRRGIATRGDSVSMYPNRPKAEEFSNTVNVVGRLRDPTDQVPNARHLHDLHTFSSVTSLVLLI